jgi:hypothetical protein
MQVTFAGKHLRIPLKTHDLQPKSLTEARLREICDKLAADYQLWNPKLDVHVYQDKLTLVGSPNKRQFADVSIKIDNAPQRTDDLDEEFSDALYSETGYTPKFEPWYNSPAYRKAFHDAYDRLSQK